MIDPVPTPFRLSSTPSLGLLLVVSAPSGSGKTTLIRQVVDQLGNLVHGVSHTTRLPRPGEMDGRDYHFVTPDQFQAMIDGDEFYEWAEVYGHRYGISRVAIDRHRSTGVDVILDLDVQGAATVRQSTPEAVLVFLLPPSLDELARRLRGRGVDDPGQIRRRLETARREIQHWNRFHYVVVNEDLPAAVRCLAAIVQASRHRTASQTLAVHQVLSTFSESPDDQTAVQHS